MSEQSRVSKRVAGPLAGVVAGLLLGWSTSLPARQELPLSHPPQAQMAWTTVGATGVPDDGDVELIRFGANGAAAVHDGLAYPTEAVLRYNVLPMLGLYASPENEGPVPRCLTVGFRDNGPDARVIVTVKRVASGIEDGTVVARFDSDVTRTGTPRPPTGGFEEDFVCPMGPGTFAGMNQRSFFVEAQLIRLSAAGNPGLQTITIEADSQ